MNNISGSGNKKNNQKYQLTELFLVTADVERTFVATRLEREHDNGEKFYTAKVKVHEGEMVYASEIESGVEKNLDIMCVLKLDHSLHETKFKFAIIFEHKYTIN